MSSLYQSISLALNQLLGSFSLLYFLNLMTASCLRLFTLPKPSVRVILWEVLSVLLPSEGRTSVALASSSNQWNNWQQTRLNICSEVIPFNYVLTKHVRIIVIKVLDKITRFQHTNSGISIDKKHSFWKRQYSICSLLGTDLSMCKKSRAYFFHLRSQF